MAVRQRFREAGEKIAAAAEGAGRDPNSLELGIQFWTSVKDDEASARDAVAGGMQSTYKLGFEKFERYTPFGNARRVADYIAPYVEAGARHINLIPVQSSPDEVMERGAEVRAELRKLVART